MKDSARGAAEVQSGLPAQSSPERAKAVGPSSPAGQGESWEVVLADGLPAGWALAKIGEVATVTAGHGFPKRLQGRTEGDIPFAKVGDVSKCVVAGSNEIGMAANFISESDLKELRAKALPKGATVFAKIGEAIRLNRRAMTSRAMVVDNNVMAVIPSNIALEDWFFFYFFKTVELGDLANATTVPSVRKSDVLEISVPLPPLPEQRRIVSAIESLQERSSRAKQALSEVGPLLSQLRQSVLRSAFNGDLTADWRAQNPHVEPASELLARIRTERRERWEAEQLAKYQEKGKKPPKNWQDKYKEPEPVDESELPELPEGWCWTTFGEAFDVHVGATPSRKVSAFWEGTIRWVSSGEVAFCRISTTKETITEAGLANSSTELHQPGTILLGMIGEGKTRGQAAILNVEACNNQNSAAIRVSESPVPPEYIYHYLFYVYEQTRQAGSGNNQPALNKSRVQAMTFALAPLEEQKLICEKIEEMSTLMITLTELNASTKAELTQLDQSILAKAFRGELVPQDPSDEPASELLKRIREKRFLTETKSLKEPIKVVRLGAEGGGAEIMATVKKGVWSFWQEGSFMDFDKDDNEIWRKFKTDPVGSIGEVIEDEWWFYYPRDPHPAFVPSLRDWYQNAFEKLSESDKQKHSEFKASEWQEMFLEAGLK